jgi:hypothetical protein
MSAGVGVVVVVGAGAGERGAGRLRSLGVWVGGVVLAAGLFAGCSAARSGQGTTDESCYLALPTAARAVGPHAHFVGVRKYTVSSIKAFAPRLHQRLSVEVPGKQAVCLAAYRGHFSKSTVSKPFGRPTGTLAVVVVKTPGNQLLGTLVLTKVPVRFEHTHLF